VTLGCVASKAGIALLRDRNPVLLEALGIGEQPQERRTGTTGGKTTIVAAHWRGDSRLNHPQPKDRSP